MIICKLEKILALINHVVDIIVALITLFDKWPF
jgi:hypothetical protein